MDKTSTASLRQPVLTGKLDIRILAGLLAKLPTTDPRVIVGPRVGEDAAVIDPGEGSDSYLIVTADPITFATEAIGHYGVVVNMNDIATRGGTPKWFLATLLFPEKGTDLALVEVVFGQIQEACRRFGISLVGGHTEITPGIDRVILSGNMIGEVKKERLVTTGGAKPGDLLLLVKGICIEGTSILARERGADLLAKGVAPALIDRAKGFIADPGIDILSAARTACGTAAIHAMHDPTEGGLINGIAEMAMASGHEIEIDRASIPIYEESRLLCAEFGLDPLGVIASGALLIAIAESDLPGLEKAFRDAAIPVRVIGCVNEGPARVVTREGQAFREIPLFPRDEILKIF